MRGRRAVAAAAIAAALLAPAFAAAATRADLVRWRAEAAPITIIRDDWGIAHISAPTDAGAVFGAIFAQAEDDFPRIEANYLTALGDWSQVKGPSFLAADLRARLYADPTRLEALYRQSPPWLQRLMDAWADGLNWYLATHPAERPRLITRFEPWMTLAFSEGSIGGDIERISLPELAAFYGVTPPVRIAANALPEPSGSNGVAIAPKLTRDGRALLLINPHTSFYFRSELQMESGEGLDAYGAATWGQFFIYQGFNQRAGWMHTSTGADNVDTFAETIVWRGGRPYSRYGVRLLPVSERRIEIPWRDARGKIHTRRLVVYRTRHGPVVGEKDGRWLAIAMMDRPVAALEQSFLRTKAHTLSEFMKAAALQANSSNNTIFADRAGEIAYLHPQFMPLRDDRFDYRRPVDGADPATDWKGLTPLDRLPQAVDPSTGWVFNTNDAPWSAAGPASPRKADFPRYMDTVGENSRGIHALRLLTGSRGWTLETLRAAAFDPWLPAFSRLVPRLAAAWDALPKDDPRKADLAQPVAALRAWDDRWSADSTPTSLAVFWGDALQKAAGAGAIAASGLNPVDYLAERTSPAQKLSALAAACARLRRQFGDWRTPWGEINGFQRLSDDLAPRYDDDAPSTAVPFTSAEWGSLASFGAAPQPQTKRWYGDYGNSFVAVVEFGPRVRALAVTAGGESGHPASPHFADEIDRYASGNLRPVYFYPQDLEGHTEALYSPADRWAPPSRVSR